MARPTAAPAQAKAHPHSTARKMIFFAIRTGYFDLI
jgi:hypothetical protein